MSRTKLRGFVGLEVQNTRSLPKQLCTGESLMPKRMPRVPSGDEAVVTYTGVESSYQSAPGLGPCSH